MGACDGIVRGFGWRGVFASATGAHSQPCGTRSCSVSLRCSRSSGFASFRRANSANSANGSESLCRFGMAVIGTTTMPPMSARHPAPAENQFLIGQVFEKSRFYF